MCTSVNIAAHRPTSSNEWLTSGSSASKSAILLPQRFNVFRLGQPLKKFRPPEIRLSLSSKRFSFGRFGKPFKFARPTLIRLSTSRFLYSSVRPTMFALRALSRFRSLICEGSRREMISKRSGFSVEVRQFTGRASNVELLLLRRKRSQYLVWGSSPSFQFESFLHCCSQIVTMYLEERKEENGVS